MSIVFPINPGDRRVTITASAGQTVLAGTFPLQADTDVRVTKIAADGTRTVLTLATHYAVTGVGNPTFTVTLVTPAVAGEKYRIDGLAVLSRLTSIVTAGKYASRAQDDEHDRHRIIQQELRRDVDRAATTEPGVTPPLFIENLTPGRLILAAGGNALKNSALDEAAIEAIPGLMAAAAASASAAAGSASNADVSAKSAAVSTTQSQQAALASAASAETARLAAAAAAGDVGFYDTLALATAAVAGMPEGKLVEVFVDESRYGMRTRYMKQSGSLVFKALLQYNLARLNVRDFGAIMDGASHPLSTRFATLAAAQAVYPHAVALTDEIDWCAIQAALDQGTSVLVPDGTAILNRKLTHAGRMDFRGNGKTSSRLKWRADAVSVGYECSITAQGDYAGVSDLGFRTSGTSGIGVLLDFSAQGGNVYEIEQRGHVKHCMITGDTQLTTYFLKGIRVVQGLNVLVEDNYCLGGGTGPAPLGIAGIEYQATDYHMVNAKIWKNQCLYFQNGASLMDVEGVWIEGNDFQACAVPLKVNNTLEVKNQYRIINNHFGGHAGVIWVHGVQFIMLLANEIYLSASTTDYRTHVYLEDVTGGKIEGNTIRAAGNNANTYPTLGFELVHTVGSPIGNLFHINIDNNQFFDVKDGLKHDPTNSTACRLGEGNQFHGMTGTKQIMNGNVQAYHRAVIGDGTMALPSGFAGTLCIEKRAGTGFAVNRLDTFGGFISFHQDYGAAIGSISSADGISILYNVTSDQGLKDEDGALSFDEARAIVDLITFHKFRWKQNGAADMGVFAQELHAIYPRAVTPGGWVDGESGEPCDEGTEGAAYIPWSVDYSKLMTPVARCVQGMLGRQDAIEARLAALEAA